MSALLTIETAKSEQEVALALVSRRRNAARLIEALGVRPVTVGLDFPASLDYMAWVKIGFIAGLIQPPNGWWIGDWCNFGFWEYGVMYKEALEVTGLSYRTLRNLATLASYFPRSRRRQNLTVGHHAAVVSLAPTEQDALLDRAEAGGWTVRQVRDEIKRAER